MGAMAIRAISNLKHSICYFTDFAFVILRDGSLLSVRKSFSLGDFEDYLGDIADDPDQVLRLPNAVASDAVGGQAALIQLIISWARSSFTEATLKIYAHADDLEAISKFSRSAVGLVALNLARSIQGADGERIARSTALESAIPFVETMHFGHLSEMRGFNKTTIPLICIDNARRLTRPNRLYNPLSDEVRSRRDFVDLLDAAMKTIIPRSRPVSNRKLVTSAASLIYEAFLNTHEHAQSDAAGNLYRRSVRGVLIGSRYIVRTQLAENARGHVPLVRYFDAWRPDVPAAEHAQFMEISIFDSGPGLAQTWLRKKGMISTGIREDRVSIHDEFEAVLGCFRKGGTTKIGETSGNGLFRIMRVVSEHGGFIRVRSGRLSLLHVAGTDSRIPEENEGLEDSIIGGQPQEARAWAAGTLITAMLPLNRGRL
jgi:hypothetical protein